MKSEVNRIIVLKHLSQTSKVRCLLSGEEFIEAEQN